MEKPKPTDLARDAGISHAYAWQILSNDADAKRRPSISLAIHIYRTTGWKHPSIADLTPAQIKALEVIKPWKPKQGQAA